ncbi:hypothetical protein [Paracraurococcus lichenis]|uniref:Uncharacterized protein n=1 Tax=Paracraurococcus lichenis TaxID=3064888 RepID=A0ABT9E3Q0_9PROT|nr:hypothetical protein [Paracraurococcus sp. LOR1-02]MDO9710792.1 hypothetical protein [Paracraurococcus sp. LOR1-02]
MPRNEKWPRLFHGALIYEPVGLHLFGGAFVGVALLLLILALLSVIDPRGGWGPTAGYLKAALITSALGGLILLLCRLGRSHDEDGR